MGFCRVKLLTLVNLFCPFLYTLIGGWEAKSLTLAVKSLALEAKSLALALEAKFLALALKVKALALTPLALALEFVALTPSLLLGHLVHVKNWNKPSEDVSSNNKHAVPSQNWKQKRCFKINFEGWVVTQRPCWQTVPVVYSSM